MKSLKKIALLSLLSFSLALTGCENLFTKTSTDTVQNADGSTSEITVTENQMDKTITTTEKKTYPDGTIEESTKVDKEDGSSTLDKTTTYPDGKKSTLHSETVYDDRGNETTESTETITYPPSSNKKTEKIETKKTNSPEKGAVEDTTTTIEFQDGSREVTKINTEGKTGKSSKTRELTKADGSSEKETMESQINWEDNSKPGYTQTDITTSKDSSGNTTKEVKIVSNAQNQLLEGLMKKETTTTIYENGVKKSIEIITERPALGGINDGSYIREVKDGAGTTTLKEMEYYFYSSKAKALFKEEGTNNESFLTGTLELNKTTTHKCFYTPGTYDTEIFYNNVLNQTTSEYEKTLQIRKENGVENTKTYIYNNTLTVSWGSKF